MLNNLRNWIHLHLAAFLAALGALLVGASLLLSEALRKREAAQNPLPPVLDPKPAQDRADALKAAQGLEARRQVIEAQEAQAAKPTPEEEAIAAMDAQALADEWQRLKNPPRIAPVKGGTK